MYQFSRAVYRELSPMVAEDNESAEARRDVLEACERAFSRLATDRHYFARPSRSLFNDIRMHFPMTRQMRVFRVVDRYMSIATEYVARREKEGLTIDGTPLCCHASTRKGTACQRVPLPGSKYCPSHKHLEEDFTEVVVAA
ncbi:MAG TPA: hypothetical protein VJT75_02210 [Thermoleophilaceae bacterium]|nr:hypothetical protein [Thermoleophilaceae bacterium]